MGDETYDLGLLDTSAKKWNSSPALREVYGDIYREMRSFAEPGPALEIGSGCGFIVNFIDDVVTSDIRKTKFVATAGSAYAIEEIPGGPWRTLYLVDVLHHLREPFRFFESAARSICPGGRIIIAEPAATAWGRAFYGAFHHEPIHPSEIVAPYVFPVDTKSGDFANMAMAWSLFARDRDNTVVRLSEIKLALKYVRFRDLLAYPATGGFSKPSLLPKFILRGLLPLERRMPQFIMKRLGLRMTLVIERSAAQT